LTPAEVARFMKKRKQSPRTAAKGRAASHGGRRD
jgi:hypothetical protein